MYYKELLKKIIFNRKFDLNFDFLIDEYRDKNDFQTSALSNSNYLSLDFYFKINKEPVYNSSDIILACPSVYTDNILFYQYNENKNGYEEAKNLFIQFYNDKSEPDENKRDSGALWISLQLINKNTIGERIRVELKKIIDNINKKIDQKDLKFLTFKKNDNGNINIYMKEKFFIELWEIFEEYSWYKDKTLLRKDEIYSFFQLLDENKYFEYFSDIDLSVEYEKVKKKPYSPKIKSWRSDIGKIVLENNSELAEIIKMIDGKVSWKSTNSKGELLDDVGTNIQSNLDNIYENGFWESEVIDIILNKVKLVFEISSEKQEDIKPHRILNLYILCSRSRKEIIAMKNNFNEIKNILIEYKINNDELKFRTGGDYNIIQLRTHTGKNKETYIDKGMGNYNTVIRQWCINKDEFINGNAYVVELYKENNFK